MKRITPIILLLVCILCFASCKVQKPTVTTSGGDVAVVTDENGQWLSDADGNLIVEKTDEEGNKVTEVLSDDYVFIDDENVKTPAYEAKVHPDFSIVNSGVEPIYENKEGTIQHSASIAPKDETDFDAYVDKVHRTYSATAAEVGEIEDVTVRNQNMKRFSIAYTDDDGSDIQAYCYITKSAERIVCLTLISKDGGLNSASDADKYIEEMEYEFNQ